MKNNYMDNYIGKNAMLNNVKKGLNTVGCVSVLVGLH